ncbi:MAG: ABC transporter substrate-binding protein [Pseudomonadota bacterium]|nr:ABC transporter substrate-binding protein [Pseudomonadota bacterium]
MRLFRAKAFEIIIVGILSVVFSGVAYAQVKNISQDDPGKMVLEVSNNLVAALNANRELLESSSAEVKVFATNYVLPYIDTKKMARYVMGKHWRVASDAQKQSFVDAFTDTMIRSYSQSLLKLRIEAVEVEKARQEKPGRVTVASKVTQSDGNKSDVIYRVYLNKSTKKWMLYDVAVEGISMLLSYRKAYDSDISKKGLDAVIAEMQEKNSAFNGQLSS